MLATDERNGAVAALPVAPFRDFQVGVVVRRRQVTLGSGDDSSTTPAPAESNSANADAAKVAPAPAENATE